MKTTTLMLIIVCVFGGGCISSDAPEVEDLPRLEEKERIMPMPAPTPAPTRAPESPVETVAPEPTPMPTPTPSNITSALCDYPPCGRGGGGGGSSGGELPDDPICELPTVLLMLAGIGMLTLIKRSDK